MEHRRRPLRVPAEVAANIAVYTNDGDLQSLCDATGTLTIDQARYHRNDPRPYLRSLVRYPDRLLSAMRKWNVVLSGSRASAFFYPSAATETSDWDFYCTGGNAAAAMFSKTLWHMGAEWQTTYDESQNAYDGNFLILHGTLCGQSIQLMWYNKAPLGAFGTIVEFHSSIVQCFISGWCAVSMYHKISSQNKIMVWELDGTRHPVKKAKAPRCVAKYVERGFEIIPYSKEMIGVNQNLNLLWNPRRIADDGCLVIDFKDYITYENQELALHDAAMEEIKSKTWREEAGPEGRELRWSSGSVHSLQSGLYRCLRDTEPTYTIWTTTEAMTITFRGFDGHLQISTMQWMSIPQPANSMFLISKFSPI